ncbi:hypothetical protein Glove_16g150 [Diversispora epigaea]|uniref:Uncharacterized protein n=1 Tax=Diversispora epigaea TaxID=1348612 RepID=A0A397JY01_9GLOM|nr:hypothetical protein Glove_285g5 [Diversispora epigaea]RHZ89320.1 hypothetical protein Glove_16g150 [Diversispora epigaea]
MPPKKRKRTEKEIIIENYNLDEVKATKEWTEKTFKILNTRVKGDTLEEKAVQILRAQNITTTMTKAHLLKEDEGKLRLRKIIGDGGIDLFGEMKRRERALRWKALRTGLTKEERLELEDLNFVEVIAKGRSIQ